MSKTLWNDAPLSGELKEATGDIFMEDPDTHSQDN